MTKIFIARRAAGHSEQNIIAGSALNYFAGTDELNFCQWFSTFGGENTLYLPA